MGSARKKPAKAKARSKTGAKRQAVKAPRRATAARAARKAVAPPRRAAPPSVPPPPPTPPAPVIPVRVVPPAPAGEMGAVREVGRLLRHGEIFGNHRIEIRHLPWAVVSTTGRLAVADPLAPAGGRVLARQVTPGKYRVMLSVAHIGAEQRVAAAVMHVGRPPIARWVVAHFESQKPPRSADQLPGYSVDSGAGAFMDALVLDDLRNQPDVPDPAARSALAPQLATPLAGGQWIADAISGRNLVAFASGWGDGVYSSYWALDGAGQPVCLVTDFEVFKAADWRVPKKPRAR